ncbi:hypothetical protein [Mesorhizobium sp. B2-1-2]|uniref:hypothetical protein n=1 Tax=Mesorhizobium sp. B2-1-2 TaxID=2589973 RepID=UPI00112AF919|nr:hypothetical protein [Mesorhizobium sp. B2-1-2]TPN11708.1 hypothetical protein FJ971_09890 [Mesorhizobium sp. B2-1-2]
MPGVRSIETLTLDELEAALALNKRQGGTHVNGTPIDDFFRPHIERAKAAASLEIDDNDNRSTAHSNRS